MNKLKNRTRLCSTINTKIVTDLRELSKMTRIPVSKFLDEAIEDLIVKHKSH